MLTNLLRSIPILCYHDVGTQGEGPHLFETHLQVIKEMGFKTISVKTLYEIVTKKRNLDDKYIVLTFDDCHISNWIYTVPLLVKYGFTGVFFAITDFIVEGKKRVARDVPRLEKLSNAFRLALSKNDYSQFMNLAELKSLINDYNMEVYSHSSRHAPCFITLKNKTSYREGCSHWGVLSIYSSVRSGLPVFPIGSAYAYDGYWPKEREKGEQGIEIDGVYFEKREPAQRYEFCLQDFKASYKRIREINKKDDFQLFCWPWGHFDKLSLKALQEAGFKGSFTLERFYNGPGTNPFRLNRIGVAKNKDAKWLRNRLLMHSNGLGSRIFFKFFRKKD
ncbi:MAG: polysaccharide deacetylase family protein [Desulfonauticus sp.]|nr:polysaccharide deacetylase family protein [Desulfonauticus sp.]